MAERMPSKLSASTIGQPKPIDDAWSLRSAGLACACRRQRFKSIGNSSILAAQMKSFAESPPIA